jgi:hypothetical protein
MQLLPVGALIAVLRLKYGVNSACHSWKTGQSHRDP